MAVRAVLQQYIDDQWSPISYFSHKQTWYSTFIRVSLAVYFASRHLHYFVDGRAFISSPITSLSHMHSPSQVRQLDFISQFTSDICHSTTLQLMFSPGLLPSKKTPHQPSIFAIPAAQTEDNEISLWISGKSKCNLTIKPVSLPTTDTTLIGDVSNGTPHPYLSSHFLHLVFDKLHSLSHPGIQAMCCFTTARFLWPILNKDVTHWSCNCQCSKVHCHTTTQLSTFSSPDARCDHIHVTLLARFRLLRDSHTSSHVLTDLLTGQKPFCLPQLQQRKLPKLCQ